MKMNKKTTSILLRVFFILLFVSVVGIIWQKLETFKTEIKAVGGIYKEGIIGAPRFINPVLAQSQADHDLSKLIFTPILFIDRDGSVHYEAAKTIDVSADGLDYQVNLREDIFFEDGVALTADDVYFTIISIQDAQIKSPLAQQWEGIEVEVIDTYNLNFKLARPFNDFLYNLEIGILPKHIWENINPQEFIFSIYNTEPIGSGPYRMESILKKDSGAPNFYRLSRSDTYYKKSYIKNIEFFFFSNEKELVEALSSGSINGAYGLSPESIKSRVDKDDIHQGSLPRIFALFFNQAEQPLLASKNIREAINIGIDKQSLVQEVFSGFALPIDSPLGFTEITPAYNTQRSQELIESEGWAKNNEGFYRKNINGVSQELGFSLSTPNLEEMIKVAEHLQENLSKIGIRVTIRSYDQGNLSQNIIRSRDYESLLFGYEIKKPSDIYAFWHSSQTIDPGLNISLFKSSQVDIDLEKLRTHSFDDFMRINEAITKDIPAVFLYSPSYIYLVPESVHNTDFSIIASEDRFNTINKWFIDTRSVWNGFIKK
jgi:peptide/nickel transport system substrate-binding protein